MNSFLKLGPGIAILLALTASAPPASAAYAFAPLAVVAGHVTVDGESLAFVAWTRGSEEADEYRVYGVNGTQLDLLEIESGTGTLVPSGYPAYAVSGVLLGVESEPVRAAIVPCAYVYPLPLPPNAFIADCWSGIGITI